MPDADVDGGDGGPDGAPDADQDDGEAGPRLVLTIGADGSELEDQVTLGEVTLWIADLRVRNDRGAEHEPRRERVGSSDIYPEATEILFPTVAPATYSSVQMRLEAESGASFFLSLATEDEERIELSIERAVVVEVRCDEPAWLAPQGQLRLEVHLDAGHLVELLLDAELPEPTGGVIRLDESSAPELLDELIRLLPEAWELRCEGESDEDSNIEDPGGGQDPAPEEGAPEPPEPGGDSGSDE